MLRWAQRLPAYVVNGAVVAVGIALCQLIFGLVASSGFAQAASMGAVLASLPHLTGRALPTLRRTLTGGLLASFATLLVLAAAPYPALRGLIVAQIAFVALLGGAFGPRAGPMVFSVIIGIVFSLAQPASVALEVAFASACGVVLYSGWAFVSAKCLEARYRVLAVATAVEAAGSLLQARARVLLAAHPEETADETEARFDQLNDEVQLAQALQGARDLVYPALPAPRASVHAGTLTRLAELREIVLTSRLDLDLLGDDSAARFTRARLAVALRKLGAALTELGVAQREGREDAVAAHDWPEELPDFQEAARLLEGDERARLLPVVALRLRYLSEEVDAIRGLRGGRTERHSLSPEELSQSVVDADTWPLSTLSEHLTLRSPVLRHAVRSALALTTVYYVAYALPWTTKPYWMLLSVAVVLRGTLDDTLSRRNSRVLGTAIGCVLVAVLLPLVADPWLKVAFVVAVGAAHAFVNVRYLLTAVAGTVMALLQAHFASPQLGFLVAERLLDTVIGALFAWGFSYVLPSWERRTLPAAIERALEALRAYSACSLTRSASRAEQRLARQRAYDALAVVAAALRRSSAEPKRVRPPVPELVSTLDHAQRLMAHLSSVRSLLTRRSARLPAEQTDAALLQARERIAQGLALGVAGGDSRTRALSIPNLPGTSAEREPLPWLERRLEASLHDARLAGTAARDALRSLTSRDGRAVSP
ncbi:MAG: hypothetical protein K0R38_7289 [Polyangiaceae bacterium]|jgi:uncharacterized membrane protein YccC|nr:hypothetical protein [Polyangiaceae bacterium]